MLHLYSYLLTSWFLYVRKEVGQQGYSLLTRDHPAFYRMMTQVNRTSNTIASGVQLMSRCPQRVSITISWSLHQRLVEQSDWQGRSLSNLAAHLLELGCPMS